MSNRKLPPAEHVLDLVLNEGVSTYEVARRYGATRQAVTYCLRQNQVRSPRQQTVALDLPWQVRVEHNYAPEIRKLRILARIKQGLPVREKDRRWAEAWAFALRLSGRVVAYNPETGFYLVPQLPQDNGELVRR